MLAWTAAPSVSWAASQAALPFVVCGVVHAEITRHRAARGVRTVATPVVSTVSVWVVGAALTLPFVAVMAVVAALLAHDALRGTRAGRVVTTVVGAAVACLVMTAGSGVVAAVFAGLLYLVVTDGLSLVARRRSVGDAVPAAALGVLLALAVPLSPLAPLFVLLPVAYLQRSARGRALRYAAAHDPKTRLWNHAAWQELSSAALTRPGVRARSAVLMVDLDHFKRLNDTYGHHAGDEVLAGVAAVLRANTRSSDIVARFGGEEFSILLRGVTQQEACQAAERIRHRIAALTVHATDLNGRPAVIQNVTASIGVATSDRAVTSVDTLLVKADRWLYQAKERGRNRVCGPVLAAA